MGYCNNWNFKPGYQGERIEFDPRVPVARHIGWRRPSQFGQPTTWSLPEPDNYNTAIYDKRIHEFPFIEEMVAYRHLDGWISIYLCNYSVRMDWIRQVIREIKPWATWYGKGVAMRKPITCLTVDNRINRADFTDEERFNELGFWDTLKMKTDDPRIIDSRIGEYTASYYRLKEKFKEFTDNRAENDFAD